MLMTGPGGTGKTWVVKAVCSIMQHYNCGHKIQFLTPTGSAAALINGMTVHKGLGIKVNLPKERVIERLEMTMMITMSLLMLQIELN